MVSEMRLAKCFFLATILVLCSSFSLVGKTFQPASEKEYAYYLNYLLGINGEATQLSPALREAIRAEKRSILNSLDKITLKLIEASQGHQGPRLTGKYLKGISHNLKLDNSQVIADQVHTLEVSKQQMEAIKSLLPSVFPRRLQQENQQQGQPAEGIQQSYLIKFFFSLMFIIVSLGTLAAIASMDNGKDTLLYAKFIADVGR